MFGSLIILFAIEKKPTIVVLYKTENNIGINCWQAARDISEIIIYLGKEEYSFATLFNSLRCDFKKALNSLSVKSK